MMIRERMKKSQKTNSSLKVFFIVLGILFALGIFLSASQVSEHGGSLFELRQRAKGPDNDYYMPSFTAESQSGQSAPDNQNAPSNKKFDRKDITRAKEYLEINEKNNLTPLSTAGRTTPTPTSIPNLNYVQPILFVPSDQTENPGNSSAITTTFQLLKRWYSGPLEQNNTGFTFQVSDTIVYRAPQPLSYYKCPNHETSCETSDGIWPNVQSQLLDAGYPLWATGTSFVVFVKGGGGWSGSGCIDNCYANWPSPGPASRAGLAILGDWSLDAITGIVNSECFATIGSTCYLDPQRGAIGHELGHTFGLAHSNDQAGSIMYSWWDFPFTSLFGDSGNDEKGLLRTDSKFFSSQPCNMMAQVNQITLPVSVKSKTQFNVLFNLTNYGYCRWGGSTSDLHIVRDDVWGTKQQQVGVDTYPAQPHLFNMILTSPMIRTGTSQVHSSIWQMRSANKYFGPQMGNSITVIK